MEQLIKVGSYFIMWLLFLFLDFIWFELFVLFLVHLCIPGIKLTCLIWTPEGYQIWIFSQPLIFTISLRRKEGRGRTVFPWLTIIQFNCVCLYLPRQTDIHATGIVVSGLPSVSHKLWDPSGECVVL